MARRENQKKKLLTLIKIFIKNTDESHGISMSEIIESLESEGISAERKSIYDDILTLGELGYDIVTLPTRPTKYTLLNRPFTLAELKILVDSVEASKFVTREQSREIIAKLREYAGKYHAHELSREVYVEERIKTENSLSLENIDKIHRAINENAKIAFRYFEYTKEKKPTYRHGGKRYVVSPEALLISDENYYLVAYESEGGISKNFRVDKMTDIEVLSEKRDKRVIDTRFNPAEYSKRSFGMYGGKEELVSLECRERLAGVIIDRFGKEITFFPTDFGFRVTVRVILSPTFFAWVMGFGGDMRVLSPVSVRRELLLRLDEVKKCYEEATE